MARAVIADTHGHLVVQRTGGFTLDVELRLPAGVTTALLGPNGAGKSTLVSALAGLERLDEGSLVIGGDVVDDAASGRFVPAPDRRVGVVFQDGLLFDHLRVVDNVAFGPRSRGSTRARSRQQAGQWLERLGIPDLADRRPDELSGGQAQRVALCRALATAPDLLLLDEPLSALDVSGRASLRRTLATHLAMSAVPRLLVTHDPIEAFLLADRVAIIEDGHLTQVGTPDEIRQHPSTAYAADLAGTNLLRGHVDADTVSVGGDLALTVADTGEHGPVLVIVPPRAIALSRRRPTGSPRNVWQTRVAHVEHLGERVRVGVGAPIPLEAEITPAALAELDLHPGASTWISIKATEITVTPDM